MQIAEKYRKDYDKALERFCQVRKVFADGLAQLSGLQCYPSQANYIMCRLTEEAVASGLTAALLTERLLSRYNILIKDIIHPKFPLVKGEFPIFCRGGGRFSARDFSAARLLVGRKTRKCGTYAAKKPLCKENLQKRAVFLTPCPVANRQKMCYNKRKERKR